MYHRNVTSPGRGRTEQSANAVADRSLRCRTSHMRNQVQEPCPAHVPRSCTSDDEFRRISVDSPTRQVGPRSIEARAVAPTDARRSSRSVSALTSQSLSQYFVSSCSKSYSSSGPVIHNIKINNVNNDHAPPPSSTCLCDVPLSKTPHNLAQQRSILSPAGRCCRTPRLSGCRAPTSARSPSRSCAAQVSISR